MTTHPHLEGWRERALQDLARAIGPAFGYHPDDAAVQQAARLTLTVLVGEPSQVGDLIRAHTLLTAAQNLTPNRAAWARSHGLYRAQDIRDWLQQCAGAYTAAHAAPEDITST